MNAADRYRRFLLGCAALVFAGTPVELWLAEHTQEWLQWIPFGLSALGLIAVARVWVIPHNFISARIALGIVVAGGFFGIYEHFVRNLAFASEIRPGATSMDLLGEAIRGASPLLASGILILAGALAFAATCWRETDEGEQTNG